MPALPEIGPMDLLRTIRLVWAQYRAFQLALTELKSYSESELTELGITRGDIPRFAYEEAEQHAVALVPSRPVPRSPSPHRELDAAAA
jgi:uncharacterized protein YjiS (DUF1127 family)